jgi:hypothetical protein
MITIIILAYIANIFLNRWLNYKLWQQDKDTPKCPLMWFIPVAYVIAFIIVILDNEEWKNNWFTGKYWK